MFIKNIKDYTIYLRYYPVEKRFLLSIFKDGESIVAKDSNNVVELMEDIKLMIV